MQLLDLPAPRPPVDVRAPRTARSQDPESGIATYLFNAKRIRHHFCPTCGCAPFGTGADKDGREMAAINVRCLEGVDTGNLKVRPFDGKSL